MPQQLFHKDQAVLFVKTQAGVGIDAAPTAANAIMVNSLDVKIETATVEQKLVLPFRSGNRHKFVSEKGTMTFETDLSHGGGNGSPVAGSLPNIDPILRACAMKRTYQSTFVSDVAQNGNREAVILASDSSDVHGAYAGRSIAVQMLAGVAQAPGSTDKNVVKLAASTVENSGTTGGSSTTTAIVLSASASIVTGDYVGQAIVIGGETRTITAYDGDTLTATVSPAFTSATASTAYKILFEDDGLVGYPLTLKHFSGTIVDTVTFNSTDSVIYLPLGVVGTNYLAGMYIAVKTGGNDAETVRIGAYDVNTRKCTLQNRLTVQPSGSSTFSIIERRTIRAYDSATFVATLDSNLVKASSAGNNYTLDESRLIVSYNGTTKLATVDVPFSRWVGIGGAYTLGAYVNYTALPSKTSEVMATCWFNQDGQLYKFVDVKGTVTFERNSGSSEIAKFVLTGIVSTVEDSDLPVDVTAINYVPSMVVNNTNVSAMSLHGFGGLVISKFMADVGNEVAYRNAPGSEAVHIKGRQSKMTVTIDKTTLDAFDAREKIKSGAVMPFWFALGELGRQTVFLFETTEIYNKSGSDQDGILTDDLELYITETKTGGTGFSLTFN